MHVQKQADTLVQMPATAVETAMLLNDALTDAQKAHLIPLIFQFRGKLDPQRALAAWMAVVDSQPSLRTSFSIEGDRVLKTVHPTAPTDTFQWIHDDNSPQCDLADVAAKYAFTELRTEIGEVAKLTLITSDSTQCYLAFSFHHAIFDETSIEVLVEQYRKAYHGEALVPQRVAAGRQAVERSRTYMDYLDGIRPLTLPIQEPHAESGSGTAITPLLIDDATAPQLRAVKEQYRIGTFAITAAAACATLLMYSTEDECHLVTPVHDYDTSPNVIACRIVMTPLRPTKQALAEGLFSTAREIQEQIFNGLDERISLTEVAHKYGRDAFDARTLFGDAIISQESRGAITLELDGLEGRYLDIRNPVAKSTIVFHIYDEIAEGAIGRLEYDTTKITLDASQAMAQHFSDILCRSLQQPETSLFNILATGRPHGTAHGVRTQHKQEANPEPRNDEDDSLMDGPEHTPVDAVLTDVELEWVRFIGHSRFARTDNFFDVGGDSITAVSIVASLRAKGYSLAVEDIFRFPTVSGLAAKLQPSRNETALSFPSPPFSQISQNDRLRLETGLKDATGLQDAYPLTNMQLGMIIEMLSSGRDSLYHNVTSYPILDAEPIDVRALRAAAQGVVDRHEVLRTSFDLESYTEPIQLVHKKAVVDITFDDLREKSKEEAEQCIRTYIERERKRPFKLTDAPLIRFRAHQATGYWRLTFTEFHPILEGWSLHTVLDEILQDYRHLRRGIPLLVRPSSRYRFADYVRLERDATGRTDSETFWLKEMREVAPAEVPLDWGQDAGQFTQTYHDLSSYLPALKETAATASVSLKTVMLAVHLVVMSIVNAEAETVSTGLVCDTRLEVPHTDRIIGLFVNTVPFSTPVSEGSWSDLLQRVRQREIEIWPHRRFPQGRMRAINGGRPVANILFAYLDFRNIDRLYMNADAGDDVSPGEFDLEVTVQRGRLCFGASEKTVSLRARHILASLYEACIRHLTDDLNGSPYASVEHARWPSPGHNAQEATRLRSRLGNAVPPGVRGELLNSATTQLASRGGYTRPVHADDKILAVESLDGLIRPVSELGSYFLHNGCWCNTAQIIEAAGQVPSLREATLDVESWVLTSPLAHAERSPGNATPDLSRESLQTLLPRWSVPRLRLSNAEGRQQSPDGIEDVPGEGSTALLVRKLWEEALSTSTPAAKNDNFFEMGGTSVIALQMVMQLEKRLGARISIPSFYTDPTLQSLYNLVARELQNRAARSEQVVQLAEGKGGVAVCIHPVGGTTFCYRNLARDYPGPEEVFGINAPTEPSTLPASVEAIADTYIELTRHETGSSPHVVIGWSAGALIAHAMTTQLSASGEAPFFTVLIDPGDPSRRQPPSQEFIDAVLSQQLGEGQSSRGGTSTPSTFGNEATQWVRNTISTVLEAMNAYSAPAATVPTILAVAEDNPYKEQWQRLLGEYLDSTVELTGGHFDVFAPDNLSKLTQAIKHLHPWADSIQRMSNATK